MSKIVCTHKWEEIRDNLFWCVRCGTLRLETYSMMTESFTCSYKSSEMYGNYIRGILNYD